MLTNALEPRQDLPSQCYDICNNALIQADIAGNVASLLCPANSSFEVALDDCYSCVDANPGTALRSQSIFVNSAFNKIQQFCTANALLNSYLSAESVASKLSVQLNSYTTFSSNTTSSLLKTPNSGITSILPSSASPPSATSSTPAIPTSSIRNDTVVRTAVGGAIGGILLIPIVLIFFVLRHRRRKKEQQAHTEANRDQGDKAQLHSDDLKPDRKELEGDKIAPNITLLAELPSNEPMNRKNELPANEIIGLEMEGDQPLAAHDSSGRT